MTIILKQIENLIEENIQQLEIYTLVSETLLDLMNQRIFMNVRIEIYFLNFSKKFFKIDLKKLIDMIYNSIEPVDFMDYIFQLFKYNSVKTSSFLLNWMDSIEDEEIYFLFMDHLIQFLKKEKEFEEIVIHLLIELMKRNSNLIISYLPIIFEFKFTKPICRRYLVDLLGETILHLSNDCYKNSIHSILINLSNDKGISFILVFLSLF